MFHFLLKNGHMTQNVHVATIAKKNGCVTTIVNQNVQVGTLMKLNGYVNCDHCYSKWECCELYAAMFRIINNFSGPKSFHTPKIMFEGLKKDILPFYVTKIIRIWLTLNFYARLVMNFSYASFLQI